ncbi:MAG: SDR family NAD(P)-dependent oxidoreductase [Oscillospiraceae bacterium]|nr:SDR family NAD(P)-dependent oxidoreductase [Oscillospiraceae bacterium]
MGKLLEGKVAIVTGSGQGVGRALALKYASEGATVITNNRKKTMSDTKQLTPEEIATLSQAERREVAEKYAKLSGNAETTANQIIAEGGKAYPFFGDIGDFDTAKDIVDFTVQKCGKVDIVANVAGAFGFGSVAEISEETWDRVTNVKPKGYFNIIHFAAPYMMEQKWGRIINTTSRAFLGDWILHPEYCAANAGVVGLTRAVAIELYPYNITCNAFGPFAATRASVDLEAANLVKSDRKKAMAGLPQFTFEQTPPPEAITPFLTYLCTDSAAKVSGSVFMLAGNSITLYSEPVEKVTINKFSSELWTNEELEMASRTLFAGYKSLAEPDNVH